MLFQEKSQFQTRSGRVVQVGEDGTLRFDHVNGYLNPESAMDAEEYCQAKRDEELGRWRWHENPHYVVYPIHDGSRVAVVDERDGSRAHYSRSLCGTSAAPRVAGIHDAAHAYFEAHPERKPWDAANDGDIWVLTGAGGLAQPWRRSNGTWRSIGTQRERVYDAVAAVAGRRIWPEDAS